MHTRHQRVLRLRLSILDAGRPIERVVELDGASRLESLHQVIQELFSWTGDSRHIFTDRRSPSDRHYAESPFPTQRVWEMDHGCRDGGHVSLCEWTSSIADAFDACVNDSGRQKLFYEYAVSSGRDAHEYFGKCLLESIGACDDSWTHGWTVTIELLDERRLGGRESLPALLDGRGRSPFEEVGGAVGEAELNAILDDPDRRHHTELDEWVREHVGPWARDDDRTFDPDRFDPALVMLGRNDYYGKSDHKALAHRAGLPIGLVSAASAIPRRQRTDLLHTAKTLFTASVSFEPNAELPLTATLDTLLKQLRSETTDGLHLPESSADVANLEFARTLGVVIKRAGAFRLTRAGENVIGNRDAWLDACARGYWRGLRNVDSVVALYVLISVAQGRVGAEITDQVRAALTADRGGHGTSTGEWGYGRRWPYATSARYDDALAATQTDKCLAYLERFGVFASERDATVVTPDGHALARALLAR